MKKSIYEKILAVQSKIGKISKDKENPFYKSSFFDINGLLEQLSPILVEEGLVVIQPLTSLDGKMSLTTIVASDEEQIDFTVPLTENSDPQKMGSAITYFRRYSLQSLFCLQAEDDDANKASDKAVGQGSKKKVSNDDDDF
jgi:hypothetical protein